MDVQNIVLNHVFYQNANKYYARPVLAARYRPGMENGWIVRYNCRIRGDRGVMLCEGARFFPTKQEAWDFKNANGKQCLNQDGTLLEMEVNYESPRPVLYKEETDIGNGEKVVRLSDGSVFLSDESDKYEYFILEDGFWIVQELDGTIRVWDHSMEVPFFGDGLGNVYEINENGEYIQVAV